MSVYDRSVIELTGNDLTVADLEAIADRGEAGAIAAEARARVDAARAVVDARAAGDVPVYGVNTGFGSFAETRIDRDDLSTLQVNLLRSHAAGVGEPLPVRDVRASMALRAN